MSSQPALPLPAFLGLTNRAHPGPFCKVRSSNRLVRDTSSPFFLILTRDFSQQNESCKRNTYTGN